jgi:hypothetical protein
MGGRFAFISNTTMLTVVQVKVPEKRLRLWLLLARVMEMNGTSAHGRMAAWPHGRMAAWPHGRSCVFRLDLGRK